MSLLRTLLIGGVVDAVTPVRRHPVLLGLGFGFTAIGAAVAAIFNGILGGLLLVIGGFLLFAYCLEAKLYGYAASLAVVAFVAFLVALFSFGNTTDSAGGAKGELVAQAAATPSHAPVSPPPAASGEVATTERFDYLTFAAPENVYDQTLKRLGSEGWELVSSRRGLLGGSLAGYDLTFRRKASPGQKPTTSEEQQRIALESARDKYTEESAVLERDVTALRRQLDSASFAPTDAPATTVEEKRKAAIKMGQVFLDSKSRLYHAASCKSVTRGMSRALVSVAKMQGFSPASDCQHP